MEIKATEEMYKVLDIFLATNEVQGIDRTSYLVCNLKDERLKITFSLVFLRDWDSLETDSYNTVVLENKGFVITLPCYWISVPKELAIPYLMYIINDNYKMDVVNWPCYKSIADTFSDNTDIIDNGLPCPPCPCNQ